MASSVTEFIDNLFFSEGAILGRDDGEVFLAKGPWRVTMDKTENSYSFLLPGFFLQEQECWWQPHEVLEATTEELETALKTIRKSSSYKAGADAVKLSWKTPASEEAFEKQFVSIKDAISSSNLEKAVPVVKDTFTMEGDTSRLVMNCLCEAMKDISGMYVYGLWSQMKKIGIFGMTPELLFEKPFEEVLETMAVAGTKSKNSDGLTLLEDPKERQEHQLVIDDIVERLKPHGEVQIGETEIIDLPTLQHLKTEINLDNREGDSSFFDDVMLLHPTSSLGGYPREDAEGWLKWSDDICDRGFFGGPFGISMPDDSGICVVAIRNITWSGDELSLASGCGVIEKSDQNSEWHELSEKRDSVRKILGLDRLIRKMDV